MLRKTLRFTNQVRACRLGICAFAWMGAVAAGCSGGNEDGDEVPAPSTTAGAGADDDAGSVGSGGMGGANRLRTPERKRGKAGKPGNAGSGSMTGAGSGGGGMGAAGSSAAGSGGAAGIVVVEAKCGANDTPEKGLQGDVNPGTVNCGLTLLSELPVGGHVQGSGHCAYVRLRRRVQGSASRPSVSPTRSSRWRPTR